MSKVILILLTIIFMVSYISRNSINPINKDDQVKIESSLRHEIDKEKKIVEYRAVGSKIERFHSPEETEISSKNMNEIEYLINNPKPDLKSYSE